MARIAVVDDRVTNRNILTRLAASVEEGLAVGAFPGAVGGAGGVRWRAVAGPDHHRLQHAGDGRRQLRASAAQPAGAGRRADHRHHRLPGSRVLLSRARGRSHRFPAEPGRSSGVPRARPQSPDPAPAAAAAGRAGGGSRARAAHERSTGREQDTLQRVLDAMPAAISVVDAQGLPDAGQSAPTSNCSASTAATAFGRPLLDSHSEEYALQSGVLDEKVLETGSRDRLRRLRHAERRPSGTRWLLTTKAPLSAARGRATRKC